MAGSSEAYPVCGTKGGFHTGTLPRSQGMMPGPVCSMRTEDMIAEAIALGAYTSPQHKAKLHHTRRHKRRHLQIAKPDPKVMAEINKELGTNVNFDKLADFEGGQSLVGYIPGHKAGSKDDADQVAGRSGVTIATGFDIGQWTTTDLNDKLKLPEALRQKYKRFCSKIKKSAIDELETKGLTITKGEADQTDMRVQRFHLVAAIAVWDADPKPYKKFVELSMAQQTVILSRTYHQGTGMPETSVAQKFYDAAQKGDWVAAERALRNYAVKPNWYKVRVRQEADYLATEMKKQPQTAAKPIPTVPLP